jgi:hypothetical protein
VSKAVTFHRGPPAKSAWIVTVPSQFSMVSGPESEVPLSTEILIFLGAPSKFVE